MKVVQSSLERSFVVTHKGKEYFVNYLNSSDQIPNLVNRFHWEVFDENHEELNIFEFENMTNEEKEQIQKNRELRDQLVGFCIKHFNDYNPNFKEDF
ncbi:MAG: hypothetical protein IMZ53_06185 [Thermoplasmata archaeon]|nr:hypothetical protein [Thermoplasmata archaeon]